MKKPKFNTSSKCGVNYEEDGVQRISPAGVVVVVRRVCDQSDSGNNVLVVFTGTRNSPVFTENLENKFKLGFRL